MVATRAAFEKPVRALRRCCRQVDNPARNLTRSPPGSTGRSQERTFTMNAVRPWQDAAAFIPFRLSTASRSAKLSAFNERAEVVWFGFEGSYVDDSMAVVAPVPIHQGALGGGGSRALNGGMISAGFDAAFVLAGLGHFEQDVVVTLELSTRFLSLARVERSLWFRAGVVRSSRHFAFAQGVLASADGEVFATATAMVAPAGRQGQAS